MVITRARILRVWIVGCAIVALAVGAPAASADAQLVLPPDRADKVGVAVNGGRWVPLPPDRADGLGTARLPTMPAPVVILRTQHVEEFDWLDAAIGAAVATACALGVAAARLVRGGRPATQHG